MESFIDYAKIDYAVFGGGCFWCTEAIFKNVQGVLTIEPGYAGGEIINPTYREVCSGKTGHAEVIKVTFDKSVISYRELVQIDLVTHDPTTPNRQGDDVGPQYRSIIFYKNEEEKNIAIDEIHKMNSYYSDPVITEVERLKEFFPAEQYHHDYYNNNPEEPYCKNVIEPKITKFRSKILEDTNAGSGL